MRLGCRVVELDVWERKRLGGRDSIIVTHGGTLCSKARFRLMIRAVREHAFVHSEYPVIHHAPPSPTLAHHPRPPSPTTHHHPPPTLHQVIVTLENHVTKHESQKKMARILREELGEMLFVWKAGDVVAPGRLLKRVIIRDKPKKPREDPSEEGPEEGRNVAAEERAAQSATGSATTPEHVLAVLDAGPATASGDGDAEVEHQLLEHQTSAELSELIYIRNTKTKTLPSVASETLTGHEQFVPSSSWYGSLDLYIF